MAAFVKDVPPAAPARGRLPGWADVLAAGLAPGALLGLHLAGLLFYLNPGLPFRPAPVLRAMAVYGALLGTAGLCLQLPFLWGRPHRARRWLPGGVTVSLAFAGTLSGAHASYYAWYLPAAMNDRLLRTSLWLGLAALIFFYTVLLHALHRRPYGVRSRVGLTLLAVLSLYAMLERRATFLPRAAAAGRPPAVEPKGSPRLLVVGLDSATLDAVLPLAGEGKLPFFEGILRGGAYGRLESLSPPHRDALWITLVSGKLPAGHGVTGTRFSRCNWLAPGAALELVPRGIQFGTWGLPGCRLDNPRVYTRKALTLWEILPRLGQRAGVLGWPAAAPARDAEFALSDRFFSGFPEPHSVWPLDLAERASLFRPSPQELDAAGGRSRFGAGAPASLLRAAADDTWRQALAIASMQEHPEAAAVFVALPGLREVSRQTFGGFVAVEFEGIREPEAARATQRLSTYYKMLDELVAGLWAEGEERSGPRLLVVVSPAGVERRSDGWTRGGSGRTELRGSLEEASDGMVALYGEGIRPGALLTGARLVDLAPTVLYALGVPVARDLEGQVITAAFDRSFLASHPLTFLPSYESLAPSRRPSS
ncbi:MAG TPA: hypothetical protein DD490_17640 [Acidobacteria bacterium]|nr:hypothetical protein [Acidobacteriota bacterium]